MKFLIPLISVALVLGTAGYVFLNPGRGPVEQVDPNEKGYVEEIDGTTVLHVKGSPYEMGYQHGALLRERAKAATDGFEKLLALGNRETGIPIFVFEVALDAVYLICEKQIADRYKRE
ncbi:MAG: hypothetical protein QG656_2324, partial [Candidatus Hydrogenedentes bacterium]|nr:hypothetical protein [Candidatus Hydrogenedentota bacterium]